MFRSLVYNETKAAQLWARSEELVQNAMNVVDRVSRSSLSHPEPQPCRASRLTDACLNTIVSGAVYLG